MVEHRRWQDSIALGGGIDCFQNSPRFSYSLAFRGMTHKICPKQPTSLQLNQKSSAPIVPEIAFRFFLRPAATLVSNSAFASAST
jgi:hypothetical protein